MVHVASASAGTISPNGDGTWPPLPNTTAVELERDPKTSDGLRNCPGCIERQGPLRARFSSRRRTAIQADSSFIPSPEKLSCPKSPAGSCVSGEKLRLLRTVQRKSLSMLGPLVDPEKDCKLIKAEDSMKIKIEVPGGKIHTLSPYFVQRISKKKPLHNAPMTLIDVEGDFAAMVEVTGEISAGANLAQGSPGQQCSVYFPGRRTGSLPG